MEIKIEELLEAMEGYGTDNQPLTIGLMKAILLDLKAKKEKKERDNAFEMKF